MRMTMRIDTQRISLVMIRERNTLMNGTALASVTSRSCISIRVTNGVEKMTKKYAKGSVERWLRDNKCDVAYVWGCGDSHWAAKVANYQNPFEKSGTRSGKTIREAINKAIKDYEGYAI